MNIILNALLICVMLFAGFQVFTAWQTRARSYLVSYAFSKPEGGWGMGSCVVHRPAPKDVEDIKQWCHDIALFNKNEVAIGSTFAILSFQQL